MTQLSKITFYLKIHKDSLNSLYFHYIFLFYLKIDVLRFLKEFEV